MFFFVQKAVPKTKDKLSLTDFKKTEALPIGCKRMENRRGLMGFRQDLAGFGEPMDGVWDGCQRINTDTKKGGIVGVFRHGAAESKRPATGGYLDNEAVYVIKTMKGKIITTKKGSALLPAGLAGSPNDLYDGEPFKINRRKE